MTYDPIIAWCKHRQQSTTDKAALEELRMVITLCEGLDRQEEMINNAMAPYLRDNLPALSGSLGCE